MAEGLLTNLAEGTVSSLVRRGYPDQATAVAALAWRRTYGSAQDCIMTGPSIRTAMTLMYPAASRLKRGSYASSPGLEAITGPKWSASMTFTLVLLSKSGGPAAPSASSAQGSTGSVPTKASSPVVQPSPSVSPQVAPTTTSPSSTD